MPNQAQPTICAHNAPGQVIRPDVATSCRQCGAPLKASPRTVDAATGAFRPDGGTSTDAAYPGDGNTTNQTWAFAQ